MKIAFMYCRRENKREKLLKTIGETFFILDTIIITQCAFQDIVLASSVDQGVAKANQIGLEIWKVIKVISMWTIAGLTAKEILQAVNDGVSKSIGKILVKYMFSYGVIVFIVRILLWIDELGG